MKDSKNTNKLEYIILSIGLFLGVFRLFYFLQSDIPLGYDPGMYKEIFSHYRGVIISLDFSLLPQWIRHEPLLGILAALGNKIGISFDRMLTRGIGIINLIPGLLLFWWFKKHKENGIVGAIIALLYWISITQYEVFWNGYFKQTLGVSLMLIVLFLGEQKKILLQSLLFLVVILLHKHTALYTGGILAISLIIETIRSKKISRKHISYLTIAGIIGLSVYIPLWSRIMTEAVKAVGENVGGDFMNLSMYIEYSWPIVLLSILGFIWRTREKTIDMRSVGYILGIVWIILGLVNYNRTLVFWDIFVVIFAGYFLYNLYQTKSRISKAAICTLIGGISIYYMGYVGTQSKSLISPEEFRSIENLEQITEPNAIIISSHRNYSPRIMGRSQRDYINPGMADLDLWTHAQRDQRRLNPGNTKCELLKNTYTKLDRPLYLWMGELQFKEDLSKGDCFKLITSGSTRILYKINLK